MVKDNYFQFGNSIRGFSHRLRNIPCQDACRFYKDENQDLMVLAVADGHGSEPLSQIGSKIIVESACKNIVNFVKASKANNILESFDSFTKPIYCSINSKVMNEKHNFSKPSFIDISGYKKIIDNSLVSNEILDEYEKVNVFFQSLNNLEKYIVYDWYNTVRDDFASKKEKEPKLLEELDLNDSDYNNPYHLYGTTLLAAIITNKYWFAMQVGDGTCIALFDEDKNNNEFKQINQPIPDDERCYSNITTSICDSDSYLEFRHCFGTKLPKAIFLGSDGIENSFTNKDRNKELQDLKNFYIGLIKDFRTDNNRDEKLTDKLTFLTEEYSGDDVTLAGIIDNSWLCTKSEIVPFGHKGKKKRKKKKGKYISKNIGANKDKNKKRKRLNYRWYRRIYKDV